ncbi:class I adenylate-forming enzyme family protein [Streptomyces sp. Inha503]|uniref:class I adenylate-forming enzyme family protein n=1 Tax=Streptomyces sp. Inha503 TaxID=3383314 RepID=UPI0039A1842E
MSWLLGNHTLPGHIDPQALALEWPDGRRTYGELRDRALRLAAGLRDLGLKAGDRVGVHLFNRGETFEIYFACAYAGLVMAPVNFRFTEREIGFVHDDSAPAVVFTEPELRPALEAGLERSSSPRPTVVELEAKACGPLYERLLADASLAAYGFSEIQMLLYTSGTTGRPKGVEMRHRNIMWCAMQQSVLYTGMAGAPVTMLTGPMYNTAALNEQSIPTFLAGGTVTIMPSRGWKPARMAELMSRWQVTHALIYPSMMEPMLAADDLAPLPLGSLRCVVTGGESCPAPLLRRFKDRWPKPHLFVAYGSTESGIVSLLSDDEIWERPGSVGRPAGGQTFAVVDNLGRIAPVGTVGEVVTCGPSVVSGYWNAPELTQSAFTHGWLKMGDLGRIDSGGYLYIEGRSKDVIISKGQNVYPAEIEIALSEHTDILDAAVVGVPDAEAGEAVCACVVPKPGAALAADDVRDFVRARLASYKKPKHVVFLSELPRNPSGKVVKAELSQVVGQHTGGVS